MRSLEASHPGVGAPIRLPAQGVDFSMALTSPIVARQRPPAGRTTAATNIIANLQGQADRHSIPGEARFTPITSGRVYRRPTARIRPRVG